MNATEAELRDNVSTSERLAEWSALLIIAGLLIEVVLAAAPPSPEAERWSTVFATVLIALGVYGELHFSKIGSQSQGELTRRSNKRLEEAYDLAFLADSAAVSARGQADAVTAELAKARREAAQLRSDLEAERRAQAGRVVSPEVIENLKALKGVVPAITLIEGRSTESSWFSHDLLMAFLGAGIGVERYEGTRQASGTGLMLYLPEGLENLDANPLYKALRPLGHLSASSVPLSDADKTIPMLLVGEKTPTFVDPPGWIGPPKPVAE